MAEGNSRGNGIANTDWTDVLSGEGPNPILQPETLYFPSFDKSVVIVGLPDLSQIEGLAKSVSDRWDAADLPIDSFGATLTLPDGNRRRMSENEVFCCVWAERCVVEPHLSFAQWALLQTRTGGLVAQIVRRVMEKSGTLPMSVVTAKNA